MCVCVFMSEETRVDLQRQEGVCVCVYVKDTGRSTETVCVRVKDTNSSTETGSVCVCLCQRHE